MNCASCQEQITGATYIETPSKKRFHHACFLCSTCQKPFPGGDFYEDDEGRVLCKADYAALHAPRCAFCNELLMDKFITAMGQKWHVNHFVCSGCGKALGGVSFVKRDGKPFCKPCNDRLKSAEALQEKKMCARCCLLIDIDQELHYDDHVFHPHHFDCETCKRPLDRNCKQQGNKLYCPEDYARLNTSFCHTCKKPILTEHLVEAQSNLFHRACFKCSKCEEPFATGVYWELDGQILCKMDYTKLTSVVCDFCSQKATAKVVTVFGKQWCEEHFSCRGCTKSLVNEKFVKWEEKLYCKKCFGKMPRKVRQALHELEQLEKKGLQCSGKVGK